MLLGIYSPPLSMNSLGYQKLCAYQRIRTTYVRFLSSIALNFKIWGETKRSRMQLSLATLTRQFLLLSMSNKFGIDKGLSSQDLGNSWQN